MRIYYHLGPAELLDLSVTRQKPGSISHSSPGAGWPRISRRSKWNERRPQWNCAREAYNFNHSRNQSGGGLLSELPAGQYLLPRAALTVLPPHVNFAVLQ
jgi:hypothetical protein